LAKNDKKAANKTVPEKHQSLQVEMSSGLESISFKNETEQVDQLPTEKQNDDTNATADSKISDSID